MTETGFGMARRTANGVDYNRINILLAILEKRCGYAMGRYDAYVNIAGGMRVNEPALDLALVMALVSSFKNRAVDPGLLIFGEVGLSGEVRAVSQATQRVSEAVKMGFTSCLLPCGQSGKTKRRKQDSPHRCIQCAGSNQAAFLDRYEKSRGTEKGNAFLKNY